jgi:hypothetical protein
MGRFSKTTTKAQRAEMERLKQENAQLRQALAVVTQESIDRLFAGATLMVERDLARLELSQAKQERDQAILERDQALVDRNAVLDHLDALA